MKVRRGRCRRGIFGNQRYFQPFSQKTTAISLRCLQKNHEKTPFWSKSQIKKALLQQQPDKIAAFIYIQRKFQRYFQPFLRKTTAIFAIFIFLVIYSVLSQTEKFVQRPARVGEGTKAVQIVQRESENAVSRHLLSNSPKNKNSRFHKEIRCFNFCASALTLPRPCESKLSRGTRFMVNFLEASETRREPPKKNRISLQRLYFKL